MSFEVASPRFSGPLHLLLELIEGEKLPITEVSLAEITEAYLKHLDVNEVPSEELADFLVVATKLLLIKSRAILPAAEPETEDASHLADQVRLYKMFVDASKNIEDRFGATPMFAREKPMVMPVAGFQMPPDVTGMALRESFAALLKRLEPFLALRQTALERTVTVQERMEEIRSAILERSRVSFSDVVRGARSKVDVVVSFLALLELVKQRVVVVAQSETFQDILIKKVD